MKFGIYFTTTPTKVDNTEDPEFDSAIAVVEADNIVEAAKEAMARQDTTSDDEPKVYVTEIKIIPE